MEIYEDSQQFGDILQEMNERVVQKDIAPEEMEFNSEKVEPPMNFYLSSLEEQVRCKLLDSKARLTPTTSEGRVLLEIDEDCLQHFLDVLQVKNDREQLDGSVSKLTAALNEADQQLKDVHLQWQEEKSALCDHFHSQVQVTASIHAQAQEREALKHTQVLHQAELFQKLSHAKVVELVNINTMLKADLDKTKQELKNSHRQWQQNINSSELYQTQVKIIAHFAKQESDAKQALKTFQALHQTQMEQQTAEINVMKSALENSEALLKTEHLRFQEQLSYAAHLEETCCDFRHAQVKTTTTIQSLQEEVTQMLKGEQVVQAQMAQQTAEINVTKSALENSEAVLKNVVTAMLKGEQVAKTQMEQQTAEIKRIKEARKITEDLLNTERFLRQQEQSSLLHTTEKDLLTQIPHRPKKKKKLFKLF